MPTVSDGIKTDRIERWSSVDEISDHLGVVRDTIYRWIASRGLPARRIGRLWKFKLSAVEEWMRAESTAKNSPPRPHNPSKGET